ncbi:30S ribosomal protein S6 [Hordeum vulgare]|nr:30S ribosomal protein S6 [Hordeum vulgare]
MEKNIQEIMQSQKSLERAVESIFQNMDVKARGRKAQTTVCPAQVRVPEIVEQSGGAAAAWWEKSQRARGSGSPRERKEGVPAKMPLYDCMLMVKPMVTKEAIAELVARVAARAYQRNGVVTDLKSFGKVHLGYGIRKLDGRHFQVRPDSPLFICTPQP